MLSMQRALWEQVTRPCVAWPWRCCEEDRHNVEARFLYDGHAGDTERDCTSLAEIHCIADMPPDVTVAFSVIEHASLDLMPGEEWVYLRHERGAG